jgi:hypothetical protein
MLAWDVFSDVKNHRNGQLTGGIREKFIAEGIFELSFQECIEI